ncbi:hypothetical protein Baya_10924 [Bagarius yarrelli]|uniref:Uncharacterized protein n=1 Tax=Bagarius yarrelli TaxID=175774 RepID=A0A556V0V2_BAGYA|nr:hypothetical protein Baya_10924 [Bagarius yarrelli]
MAIPSSPKSPARLFHTPRQSGGQELAVHNPNPESKRTCTYARALACNLRVKKVAPVRRTKPPGRVREGRNVGMTERGGVSECA